MKIRYTEYNNSKEATELSKGKSILSFFLLAGGFVVSLFIADKGGFFVLLGILNFAAVIAVVWLLSKVIQKQIEEKLSENRSAQYEELRKQAITRELEDRKQLEKQLIRYQEDLLIVNSGMDSMVVKKLADEQRISAEEVVKHAKSRVDSMERRIRIYNENHIIQYPFTDNTEE